MSSHSSSPSESDRKSIKTLLKMLAKDFQSLSHRQMQHELQIIEDKKENDAHLAILEEELKVVKEKDEYLKKIKRSSHASSSRLSDSYGEESLIMNEYYQPQRSIPKETRVDLPHFYGKENVETYLDWEMIVEQLFVCHHVSEERKVP